MNKNRRIKKPVLNFIDLFSGAGGLSHGLEMAGMKCLLGVDMDKNAIETFRQNHLHAQTFKKSIHLLDQKTLDELVNHEPIHAVVGGPPCQGFSTAGIGDPKDERNQLFRQFLRIVKMTNPYFVVVENVTGLLAKKNEKTLKSILKEFVNLGYTMQVQVLSAEKYGVPEKRRRTVFIGTRVNDEVIFPEITCPDTTTQKNVGEAIKSLAASDGNIYNHDLKAAELSNPTDAKRLACIPEGCGIRYALDEKKYFKSPDLLLGIDWDKKRENRLRQTRFQRLHRNLPGPTIMTSQYSYYHPVLNRRLTARECAAIQSFPNDFIFHGKKSSVFRQIGNAVPPLLGKAIGTALNKMYQDAIKNQFQTSLSLELESKKYQSDSIVKNIRGKAFIYREDQVVSPKKEASQNSIE